MARSKDDERFARQYRYEPPSEFPLTSPFSGIVHHLSGPNRCAHTQTSQNRLVGCWCKNPSSHFHYASRFGHPGTCTYVRLLGPCFKTGRVKPFCHHLRVKECTQQRGSAPAEFPRATNHKRGIATRHEVFNLEMSSARHIQSPVSNLPGPSSFPQLQIDVDKQGKKHHTRPLQSQQPRLR